tara:strand:+ start:1554 stop:1808 length:255 start_codon:yes stop_codon:yes gene_type:complete
MTTPTTLKLSDSTIAQIAKCLQVAILSGTDVVDNLRQMRLVDNNGELYCDPQYLSDFEHGLAKMMEEIEKQNTENQPEQLGLFD